MAAVPEVDGIIIPHLDIQKFADAVSQLIHSPEKQAKLGKRAHSTSMMYTWERVALKTVRLFAENKQ